MIFNKKLICHFSFIVVKVIIVYCNASFQCFLFLGENEKDILEYKWHCYFVSQKEIISTLGMNIIVNVM